MKIINAHVHLIELEAMLERQPGLKLPGGVAVLSELESTLPLLTPEKLLEQMDEAGVDTAFLYAVEAPIVYSSNEYVCSIRDRYPSRFVAFASVNPLMPDAVQRFERAVREHGMKGLKLHPPLQDFFPNDEAVFPVYEKAVELNIPVVFHVGTTPFGSLCRLATANPILLDDVAVRFPELRILLTHLGTLWHNEAFMVVEKNPNVFVDTAAYINEIETVLTPDIVRRIGVDKIVFGTDYPMPYAGTVHRMSDFVECMRNLHFSRDELEQVFHANAQRFLNGGEPAPDVSLEQMLARWRKSQS